MQLRHHRTVTPGSTEGPLKVSAIAWSPNSTRLALATADRVVSLFDEHGEQRKDKFSTKPVRRATPSLPHLHAFELTHLALPARRTPREETTKSQG